MRMTKLPHFKAFAGMVAILALGASALSAKAPVAGQAAPAFSTTGLSGNPVSLGDQAGKIVVLEWTNYNCPFVKKFYESGEMQKLQKQYTDAGVVWYTVNSAAEGAQGYGTAEEWKQRLAKSKAAATDFLIDTDGAIGHAYGARVTPQMVIIGADGTLVFNGAIDSIPSDKAADIEKAENYVSATLDALLKGEKVEPRTNRAYGCGIKYSSK